MGGFFNTLGHHKLGDVVFNIRTATQKALNTTTAAAAAAEPSWFCFGKVPEGQKDDGRKPLLVYVRQTVECRARRAYFDGPATLSITTFSILTLSITTFSIMTPRI
jgi:hypothetical protein